MKYAPIVLFAYNRLDELKQTITALQKNILANKCELFIYSDAAKNEGNEGKVQDVRDYLHSIKGFKKVYIVERHKNLGLAQSVIEGVSEIIKKYKKVIVLEDDLITSENFLCYMNHALDHYETIQNVFSISGFSMPLKSLINYDKDSYVALRPASWGWATWQNQWDNIDWNVTDYNKFINNTMSVRAFNRGGIDLSRMLEHYMKNKNNSWAIRWAYAMFKENKFCIYPKVSKVQNIGFGENATHCNGVNIYNTTLDESASCDFDFESEIVPNNKIINEFGYQYSFRNKLIKKSISYIKKTKNMKPKLLCILHRSPPDHGAAKVGDFIASSRLVNTNFECKFITIKSSNTIGDIGKINVKKIYFVAELYFKVLLALLVFRPQKIYFTASIRSVAFYRDLLISTLWKFYKLFTPVDIYYHYHTKGVNEFVSASKRNLVLTHFFVKNVTLVLLSPLLKKDFDKVESYKQINFLPNGVEDIFANQSFEIYLSDKYKQVDVLNVLYLAHMMKEKGYWDVLELAEKTKEQDNIIYHFAGSWKDKESEVEFFKFIKTHALENHVIYHGFVSGDEKASLFKKAHLLAYPSKNDAFPLTLLESLSYGVPIVATDEGSIPYMLDEKSGFVIDNIRDFPEAFDSAKENFINEDTAKYCRERFLEYFTQTQFENNLIEIFKDEA